MARRTMVAVAGCLALFAADAAGAQTTTSTTTAGLSTTTTTTLVTTTTSTTVPDPCRTQACTPEPPNAFLSGVNGEVQLDQGNFCWRSPTPDAQGNFVAICAHYLARDPDAVLVVRPGETLTLRFGAMAPTFVQMGRGEQVTALTPGNPVLFAADFAAGSSPVLRFFTRWLQGDASYSVRLDVRATAPPATPRPGIITLTG